MEYEYLIIGKIKMLPIFTKFSVNPHNNNPLAGNNSGIYSEAIRARVLKQVAKKMNTRTIIIIKAI